MFRISTCLSFLKGNRDHNSPDWADTHLVGGRPQGMMCKSMGPLLDREVSFSAFLNPGLVPNAFLSQSGDKNKYLTHCNKIK